MKAFVRIALDRCQCNFRISPTAVCYAMLLSQRRTSEQPSDYRASQDEEESLSLKEPLRLEPVQKRYTSTILRASNKVHKSPIRPLQCIKDVQVKQKCSFSMETMCRPDESSQFRRHRKPLFQTVNTLPIPFMATSSRLRSSILEHDGMANPKHTSTEGQDNLLCDTTTPVHCHTIKRREKEKNLWTWISE